MKEAHNKDHTYSDKNRPRKPASKSRNDHEYCTAMEADEGSAADATIEEANTSVALRDCGCPHISNQPIWWNMVALNAGCRSPLTSSANVIVSTPDAVI